MNIFRKIKIILKDILKKLLFLVVRLFFLLYPKKKFDDGDINAITILCFSPMGIGDLLMNMPSIRELRKRYKNKKIILVTDKDILNEDSNIDKIIKIKPSLTGIFKFGIKNRKKFDIVLLLNKALPQSFLAFLLRPKYILGYIWDRGVRANFELRFREGFSRNNHYYDMGFKVVKELSVLKIKYELDPIKYSAKDMAKVKSMVGYSPKQKYIIINPYVLWKSRMWPMKNYQRLIEKLLDKDLRIIISGGPGEIKYNSNLQKPFLYNPDIVNITGKVNLYEFAALMDLAELLITGDAGPMHIAVAQKTKILSLWGPTNPLNRLPHHEINKRYFYIYDKNNPCANCYNLEHEPFKCDVIDQITVEGVYKKCLKIIKR